MPESMKEEYLHVSGLGSASGYYLDRDFDPLSTGLDLLPLDFGFTLDFFFPMCA